MKPACLPFAYAKNRGFLKIWSRFSSIGAKGDTVIFDGYDLSERGGRQAEQTLSIRMRSLPAAPLAYAKNQQYHHDLPAHDKNRGFFDIHYGEYIVLENIYILLYTQSPTITLKNGVFGLDFLAIGAKGDYGDL